jgi:hypothetical protein
VCPRVPQSRVPADIRDFIVWYLPNVEHLEVFMVLHQHSAQFWSAAEIAEELRIPEGTAGDVLERLASNNFLDIKISNDILYRFNPAAAHLTAMADKCAEFYTRDRIAVINLVTARGLDAIRNFAEAFRLRKGKADG